MSRNVVYSLTHHAKIQAKMRIGVSYDDAERWANDKLASSEFLKRGQGGRLIYGNDNLRFVVSEDYVTVITVYTVSFNHITPLSPCEYIDTVVDTDSNNVVETALHEQSERSQREIAEFIADSCAEKADLYVELARLYAVLSAEVGDIVVSRKITDVEKKITAINLAEFNIKNELGANKTA